MQQQPLIKQKSWRVPQKKRCSKDDESLASWELTYPIKNHFWRCFSFSQGGICDRSQEGNCFNFPGIFNYISKPFAGPPGEDDSMVAKQTLHPGKSR